MTKGGDGLECSWLGRCKDRKAAGSGELGGRHTLAAAVNLTVALCLFVRAN